MWPTSGADFVVLDGPVDGPGLADQVAAAVTLIEHTRGVNSVRSCYVAERCEPSSPLRAPGGDASLVVVSFVRTSTGDPPTAALNDVQTAVQRIRNARVLVGGDDYFGLAATSLAESNLLRGELLGLLAAVVVLTAFIGVRGALIPLLGGIVTFAGAFVLLLPLTAVTAVDAYGINIVTMLGLGLSLDYGLLMLTRYRQARSASLAHEEALTEASQRAGRTIVWSGLTVIVCLSALLVFGDAPFTSIALGGMCATMTAIAVARTLVPALLDVWGSSLRPIGQFRSGNGFARLAGGVRRRPLTTLGLSVFVLLIVAAPAFSAHLIELGPNSLPTSSEPRIALTALDTHFPEFGGAAVDVVAPVSASSPRARARADSVRRLSDVRSISTSDLANHTLIVANVAGADNGPSALHVVKSIRALHYPFHLLVGGEPRSSSTMNTRSVSTCPSHSRYSAPQQRF